MEPMNLFCRSGMYYIRYSRREHPPNGKLLSLETRDEKEAKELLKGFRKEWHENRLVILDGKGKYVKLSKFKGEYAESRQDLDDDTLRADELALRLFMDAVGDKPIALVTVRDFDKFKKKCQARGNSPFTINSYLRHLRAAFNTAAEWGYIKEFFKVKGVKVPKRLPNPLSLEQIAAVKAEAKKSDYEHWRVIVFSLWTGCRREEILGIKWQNFDGLEAVRVIGKGDKERVIPLADSEELREALGKTKDVGPVFRQQHKDNISKRTKAIFRKCGIPEDLSHHNLRASAATFMLSCGIELKVVKEILGHADIRTTEIYASVVEEVKKREIQKLRFE